MSYWKADPHRWGPGKIHRIHADGDKTLCGNQLKNCPGQYVEEIEYNCMSCAKVFANQEQREAQEKRNREWEARQIAYQEQRARENQEWWERYNRYLRSPQWRAKHDAVMRRANGVCEGCHERKAIAVHHTTYEHVFHEPLFELRAVCHVCHEGITTLDRNGRR